MRALAWNFNDGQLYGLTCAILSHSTRAYFYEINPETGAETMHRDFRTETTSLVLPQKRPLGAAGPAPQIRSAAFRSLPRP